MASTPISMPRWNIVAVVLVLIPFGLGLAATLATDNATGAIAGLVLGALLYLAPRVAQQRERAVVLRLGRYRGLTGPGLFWTIPLLETVPVYIDQRTIATGFAAEETLTSDTVPVNVDAVLF